jgi:short subunit dehydrogenase-like uncharacterized protein
MRSSFLLYGATGFVGEAIARLAVQRGLKPILAGRNPSKIKSLAAELGLDCRVFGLDDSSALDKTLAEVALVLHCAGPYIHTFKPMVEGCLRTGTHYLDITGEIPVLEALAALNVEAKSRNVMLLPAVGFDVVPTDCLALHLKQRLPSATRLSLAFQSQGPAGLPPGTQKTAVESLVHESRIRRQGLLVPFPKGTETRLIDFGRGPVRATLFPWGDVFTAFYSTGIPNISDYMVLPPALVKQMSMLGQMRALLKLRVVRQIIKTQVMPGPSASARAQTHVDVWGEVEDDKEGKAVSRLHGPEAGVDWTSLTALAAVGRVLSGQVAPGFQTPARAYGADFVLECECVTREDVN